MPNKHYSSQPTSLRYHLMLLLLLSICFGLGRPKKGGWWLCSSHDKELTLGINIPHWYRIEHTVPPAPPREIPQWRYRPSSAAPAVMLWWLLAGHYCTASLHPTYILHFQCCNTSSVLSVQTEYLYSRILRYEGTSEYSTCEPMQYYRRTGVRS